MKCKKIWIAEHPEEPGNCEVSFVEPNEGIHIYPEQHSHDETYVPFKEFVIIEVES